MLEAKAMRKALRGSITTVSELVDICKTLSNTITPENFVETEHSGNTGSIFEETTNIRTIESWVSKITNDFYDKKRGGEARGFKVSEVIDVKIREFAESDESKKFIEALLKRKLTQGDVVRLLWIGDQGYSFTKRFMDRFAQHLEQLHPQQLIDLTMGGDE